jgi:phytoene dehydrogenase-like protein
MDRHFNINPYYDPIYDSVDMSEEEKRYYQRSRQLIDAIIKAHKDTGGTILLSGHAGSIETVGRGIVRRRARPERLQYEADKVNYCNFAVLERDANTHQWTVHSPITFENPLGRQRTIQSSIPLYRATSMHIPTQPIKGSLSFPDALMRDRAYHYYRRYGYR